MTLAFIGEHYDLPAIRKAVSEVEVIANLEQRRLYVHESFLTKNLQEVVAPNSVHGSNASSPQPNGEVAKVLHNYLISKKKTVKKTKMTIIHWKS